MTYVLITPPSAEPLTLAEARAHLRIDQHDEDALLLSLIRTARDHLERETGLCLIAQSWRLYLDRWMQDGIIRIARSPIQAIQNIRVHDADAPRLMFHLKIICSMAQGAQGGCGSDIRRSPARRLTASRSISPPATGRRARMCRIR